MCESHQAGPDAEIEAPAGPSTGQNPAVDHIMPPDEHGKRHADARRRLAETLDPKTNQERELVTWLGDQLDLQRLLVLVELVEYAAVAELWFQGTMELIWTSPVRGRTGSSPAIPGRSPEWLSANDSVGHRVYLPRSAGL
jgi:hypothetical protein